MNRVAFHAQLGQEWLPAVPDVHARLRADPPARVADIGCGFGSGHSSSAARGVAGSRGGEAKAVTGSYYARRIARQRAMTREYPPRRRRHYPSCQRK